MKKLLSVVLVLAMLASMCVYLPMGVSATEGAATTIYAEDFTDMDGEYTLGDLADMLGWTLLRGDDAATAVIADGKLTIDNTALTADVVFEMATDAALKANHTIQYDLVQGTQNTELANYKLFFAGVYTGTDDGENTKAIINKTTYEGYNHMSLVDGVLNKGNIWAAAYKIGGGDHSQCRPENLPGGATNNTWKTVVDVTNNQVDAYASGARMNSTVGGQGDSWAKYNVADYVGEGAYLRVQIGRVATFDNISIVTGGDAIVSTSNVLYNQTFDGITYDAENETSADLAAKIGFQTLNATAKTNSDTATMKYAINNGRLEILAVPADGKTASGMNGNQQGLFGTLFLPEMENAKEAVVIEYDMTYLYDPNQTGSLNHGDAPFSVEMYGRRGDFEAWWMFTQKGFPFYGFRNGSYSENGTAYYPNSYGFTSTSSNGMPQTMGRWEDTYFKGNAGAYNFSNNPGYSNSLYNSTESIKVVLDYDQGMFIYTNDILAFQLTQAQLETWLSTKGTANAKHTDIIGNLFKFRATSGCHVALDNIKVTVDPEKVAGPDLWLTEHSVGVTGGTWCTADGMEYVEVYNASTKAINIYDYALTQRAYSNSCDNIGTAIGLDNITLAYPGTHTFKSIKTDEVTGLPLYTMDVTNPDYADGWIQPGEVAMLWNKTDSMHNGGYGAPTVITDSTKPNFGMGNHGHRGEADFRAALSIPENVKVFAMYNDYNRAFNNSGSHFVALVDRALVQPSYNPATNSGDETLNNANIGFAEYKSSILDVTADTNSIRTIKTVHYASYDVSNGMGYSSVVFGRPVSSTNNDTASMTAGYVTNAQKKAFTVTVDGSAKAAYLGEDYTYAYDETSTAAPKFYKELFAVVDGDIVLATDPAYGTLTNISGDHTVQRYKIAMTTVPGVGIRFGGENVYNEDDTGYIEAAGLRWISGVKASHIDQLMNSGLVADVEIGTMITRDGADLDEDAKKVAAYKGYWFDETANAEYADMVFFAGSVKNMYATNYDRDYKGVGYVAVTLTDGTVITVTGDYTDANENNVVNIADLAYADPNNGLTDAQIEQLDIYFEQYDAVA